MAAPTQPAWAALYSQLVSQLGAGTIAVESPALGRVEFARPADLFQALNILKLEAANANGIAGAGVITCGYDRGLSPKGGC
jgi:hypothetical protein